MSVDQVRVGRRSPIATLLGALLIVLVVLVLTLPLTIPIYATLSYRSAVRSLHDELRPVIPDSAQLVDERIDNCWNDLAPASVRTFVPVVGVDESDLRALARDIQIAIEGKGFRSSGLGLSRDRGDDLDADMASIEVIEGEVRVVADVYDADSVVCFPGS